MIKKRNKIDTTTDKQIQCKLQLKIKQTHQLMNKAREEEKG